MKIQIDLKSAAFGLVAGAAILFTIGASPSGAEGRFQTVTGQQSTGQGYALILDTVSGKVWCTVDFHNQGEFYNAKQ